MTSNVRGTHCKKLQPWGRGGGGGESGPNPPAYSYRSLNLTGSIFVTHGLCWIKHLSQHASPFDETFTTVSFGTCRHCTQSSCDWTEQRRLGNVVREVRRRSTGALPPPWSASPGGQPASCSS